jgi:hypothetical protein
LEAILETAMVELGMRWELGNKVVIITDICFFFPSQT